MRFIVTQKYNLPTFSIALQIMFYFENFDNFWCADTRINFQPNSKRLSTSSAGIQPCESTKMGQC